VIDCAVFTGEGVERYEEPAAARDAPGTTWVRATEATREELLSVAEAFGIHHLSVEDVAHGTRAKTEEYPDHTFVLATTATLRRGQTSFEEEIRSRQVGLFVGGDWLVTLSAERVDPVDRVWAAAVAGDVRVRRQGPDYVAYRVLDRVVDDYFELLDEVETTIEEIEDGVLGGPDPDLLAGLNAVRRDLLSFRKVLWPMREAVGSLARGGPDFVQPATEKYYRDVYDHLVQLVDLTETYRDLVGGTRDIYQNTVAQSTNEVMKTLTVVATIILPLTFVVGLYGMNFEGGPFNMPELGWTFGYPGVVAGMALVSLILLVAFRAEGWL
jgi:magnesium transporter